MPSSESSGSSPGGHQDGAAQAQAQARAQTQAAARVKTQLANEQAIEYFAAGVCGIIVIVTLLHWTRRLYVRFERGYNSQNRPWWALPFVVVARKLRPILLHRMPPFPSISHFIVVFSYIGLNAALLVINIDLSNYSGIVGARAGWLAVCNVCVSVFLALKHTPMAPLSRTSYERLNPLHQLAGVSTISMVIIHGVGYTIFFFENDLTSILKRPSDIAGIVAGVATLLMGLVPLLMKTRFYEFFYIVHILTFMTLIVGIALHQPKTAKKVVIMTMIAGGIWALDRIARFVRIAFNSYGNTATLYPLPDGGTRVMLSKAPIGTQAGKHVFLWIPAIRLFQTHPFSVVSIEGGRAEFVIHSRKGFTAALHAYAQKNPGISVWASADGAYGAFPSPDSTHFDKVILIAGGSGASFTFGLAGNLLQHMSSVASSAAARNETPRKLDVDFIWAVRGRENLSWFTPSLRQMRSHPHAPNVAVSLHVTRLPHSPSSESESDEPPMLPDPEKLEPLSELIRSYNRPYNRPYNQTPIPPVSPTDSEAPMASRRQTILLLLDEEKQLEAGILDLPSKTVSISDSGVSESSHEGHTLKPGRPDLGALIDEAVKGTELHKRILIAACGPSELMKITRESAARNIRANGPGVEVHCETFGW